MSEELILGPYKEPLEPVKKGFGYMGALSFTTTGKLQCHICGELFDHLGHHIRNHNLSAGEYRTKFQLASGSSLISEGERLRLKENHLRWWASMSPEERKERIKKWRKGAVQFEKGTPRKEYGNLRKLNLEQKNKRGICPEQLMKLICDAAVKLGKTPSKAEFALFYQTERFFRPISKTFGSWNDALKKANLTVNLTSKGQTWERKVYETDELLEYLQDYFNREKTLPSRSDFSRGFLPSYDTYLARFGSMGEARRRAGLPTELRKGGWYRTKREIKQEIVSV